MSSALGVNSVAELKKLAQAKPESLNYATLGEGSFPDLFLRWLNNQWGTKIVGVPYNGGGPAAQALAGNRGAGDALRRRQLPRPDQERQGEGAGGLGDKRSPLLPDVPTLAEAGLERLSRPGLVGPRRAERHAAGDRRQGQCEFVKLFSEPTFVDYLDHQAVVAAPTIAGRLRGLPARKTARRPRR